MKDLETAAKLAVLQDEVKAMREIMFASLLLLHERGTLPVPALLSKLKSSTAFAQGAFDKHPPHLLGSMLDYLEQIAHALDARPK